MNRLCSTKELSFVHYNKQRKYEVSGIYLHIPFCKKACHYCNFHFSTSLRLKEDMIAALCNEIHIRHDELKPSHLDSIYFGGGTPSILNENELGAIMDTLSKYFTWDKNCEITLEANPDDIHFGLLTQWKRLGINRLSIGIQSFDNRELVWMNRSHDAEQALSGVKLAQDMGIDRISIDLIYGSPYCDEQVWSNNINQALDLNIGHLSAYNLTVEERTALHHEVKTKRELRLENVASAEHFEYLVDRLSSADFIQYEISNFGKKGEWSIHNTSYWKGKPYLGIGPSAHSYDGKYRKFNISNNPKYIESLRSLQTVFEIEHMTDIEIYNEKIMLGFRTIWGVDPDALIAINPIFFANFKENVHPFILKNWVTIQDKNYVLTSQGKLWADHIAMELFL